MLASSGLSGDCSICTYSYNEHNRYRRKGSDKKKAEKGKHTYEKCKTWWYICQKGGHNFVGDRSHTYMVCRTCEAYPGSGFTSYCPQYCCTIYGQLLHTCWHCYESSCRLIHRTIFGGVYRTCLAWLWTGA